ncbi:TetR/AcrR family transcriptional regulator [Plastoroseomonas hellenica]|uniref:TetR/AcrR family transcriptional regulator n=1 Tax=Plastoroseomonas hellenica TaxID=2687306 RepID=A0ABS5F5A5_9PROT|nr:TetR/AcrR family transcriptional regulator [Plastoroseomonas hellenica]MBR0646616.1 TetR/AcrR family transcriptional regulator [Plastoroseomonas hellenica]MBR0667761.1 TetR/AcrR family transcriptional regulator [Plastoroseomonas hellenica]
MKSRRRGASLEEAILEAAWAELVEHGYAGLTMEGVAARAATSRPVVSRRWEGKAALAIAAIRLQREKHPLDVADRGDLRAELLEFLERASALAMATAAIFTLFTSEYFRETASTPQDLRALLTAGNRGTLAAILDRAVQRGEIAPAKLAPPVGTLLGDLFRHHAIMTFSAPPPELRAAWVDDIFLPLVRRLPVL